MNITSDVFQEKERINKMLSEGIREILYEGLRIKEKSLGGLEDDIEVMLRAFQLKNVIYDYAVFITYNEILCNYEGKVAYSLINTENMSDEDCSKYESLLDFTF